MGFVTLSNRRADGSHFTLAKKNERVQRDLEEQTNQLNELKMELHRLESSAVRTLPPYATSSSPYIIGPRSKATE